MKRLVVIAALAAGLAAPAVASAFSGWHWSVPVAQTTLKQQGISWSNQNGRDLVAGARCVGLGEPLDEGGPLLFARFRCLIRAINPDGQNERYYVRIAVTGKNTFRATFLRYV